MQDKVVSDIRSLMRLYRNTSGVGAGYWDTHGQKHLALIVEFGFGNFKRTINFEYGQWGVTSLRDPKIRRLLWNLIRLKQLPLGGLLATCDYRDLSSIRWPDGIESRGASVTRHARFGGRRRLRIYAFYGGLLWQYAELKDRLGCLRKLQEPRLGNPLPVRYRGRLISQDLAFAALELNRIAMHVPIAKVRRVLEIGAGYGRLAFVIRSLFPHVEYTIVDIPPALAVSRTYLDAVSVQGTDSGASEIGIRRDGPGRMNFLLPEALGQVPDGYYDLVINVSSFDEMSPAEVEAYFRVLDRVSSGWLYLQGWGQSRSQGHRLGLNEFPFGREWRQIYSGPDPVVPGFIEKILERTDRA
jgi:putative sugar O-methyltransferase